MGLRPQHVMEKTKSRPVYLIWEHNINGVTVLFEELFMYKMSAEQAMREMAEQYPYNDYYIQKREMFTHNAAKGETL